MLPRVPRPLPRPAAAWGCSGSFSSRRSASRSSCSSEVDRCSWSPTSWSSRCGSSWAIHPPRFPPASNARCTCPKGRSRLRAAAHGPAGRPFRVAAGRADAGNPPTREPRGKVALNVTSRTADGAFFSPLITNGTDRSLRVVVNAGLQGGERLWVWGAGRSNPYSDRVLSPLPEQHRAGRRWAGA